MTNYQQLTIYISESARWQKKPLYEALIERARQENIAGAMVIRGVEGFGIHHSIHTANLLALASDLPLEIRIIDRQEEIARFFPLVKEMVQGGLVTLEDINVVLYPQRVD